MITTATQSQSVGQTFIFHTLIYNRNDLQYFLTHPKTFPSQFNEFMHILSKSGAKSSREAVN